MDVSGDYVIATGVMHSVKEFVEEAFKHVGTQIEWEGTEEKQVGKEKGSGYIFYIFYKRVYISPPLPFL